MMGSHPWQVSFFLWARVAGAGACDLERSGRQSGYRSEEALETLPVKTV